MPAFLISQAASLVGIAAYFLLLGGFALGLPSTAEIESVNGDEDLGEALEPTRDPSAAPSPGSARS